MNDGDKEPAGDFQLAGSIILTVSPEEFDADLAAERAKQAALFEAKLETF
jgi:hypothetical protein